MNKYQPKSAPTNLINKENWPEKKNKLKARFPVLTDTDLIYEEGKVEELMDKLHSIIGKTIGKTKKGLHKFIEVI